MAHPCATPVDDSGPTRMPWSSDYHTPAHIPMGGNQSPPIISTTSTSLSGSSCDYGSEEGSSSTSGSCSPNVTVTGQAYVLNTDVVVVANQAFICKHRRKTSDKPRKECDTTTDGVESRDTAEIDDDPTEQTIGPTDGSAIQGDEIREDNQQKPIYVIQTPPREILQPDIEIGHHQPEIKNAGCGKHKASVVLVILVLCMAAAIAGVIASQLKDLVKTYRTSGLVSVSVDDSFHPLMAEKNSTEFNAFSQKFCDSVGTMLAGSDNTSVVACTVQSLSKGSIVTGFSLELQTTFNTSSDWLKDLLQNSGLHDGEFTHWLNLRVKMSSINVSSLESKLSDSKVPGTYPSKVECTQPFLPLPYTYPHFCGEYQACTSTGVKYLRCPEDFEFSYDSSAEDTVCYRRSENTYCGQRRREERVSTTATAATTTDTKPLTDTTSVASSTTTLVESTVTKDTTATSLPCSEILGNKNLSELFHCPSTGYVFIPRPDTFPDHCNSYVWCVDGVTYNSSHIGCGAGAHYTTMEDGPCYPAGHPNTFCQVVRRCRDLLTQIKGYMTPSTTFTGKDIEIESSYD
ncbi:hypothetical protein C0Q70_21736 [Pomacea canaliculata]|uniref:Chitin-binding type-2 domain-containing protein n=1 Tax=Pomacea canaliculata TaxID=400727 RepID=A0A2T7NDD0_POMCA|nr:hypothetical protein C0Q70_21736 [Pomacea canaliculata]